MQASVPLESFVRPDFVACVFRMAAHGLSPGAPQEMELVSANALALLAEIMRRKQLSSAGLAVVVDISAHVLGALKVSPDRPRNNFLRPCVGFQFFLSLLSSQNTARCCFIKSAVGSGIDCSSVTVFS